MAILSILEKDIKDPEIQELADMLKDKNKNELIAWCSSRELDRKSLSRIRDILAYYEYYKHATVLRDMLNPVEL